MNRVQRASISLRISTALFLAVFAGAVAGAGIPAQAQITPTTVLALPGSTGQPVSPAGPSLTQGRDGDLYITSQDGGPSAQSMLFSLTPAGVLAPVYSPGGLLFGATLGTDGNFYGGNYNGGTNGFGTLYKVTPTGTGTVFYNFLFSSGPADPYAPPIEAANGVFYGTTPEIEERDGYFPESVAYSVTSKGVFKILHTFTGSDGQNIYAGLVQGTDGNFYGCSAAGGTSSGSDGVIFKMTSAGKVTVLHNFDGTDGSGCSYALVQASDGNFYGTAGGGSTGLGVVFKIAPGGTYSVIHNFEGTTDGSYPQSSLIQATDGNLYGVTGSQGQGDNGTIYKVTTGGTVTTLYSFTGGTDGGIPQSALLQHTNGLLYGDTFTGGDLNCFTTIFYGGQPVIVAGCGVVFSVDIGAEPFVKLMTTSGHELTSAVEILGQGFSSSSLVEFGGVAATKVTLTGTTYMSATVPAGALTGAVTVTTGATKLTSPQTFKVLPTITSIPASGAVGTPVAITGTGLTQTTKVTFGNVAATSITVNSDTQVTATVPTGAKTGKIAVTTKGGSATSKTSFTVQ